MIKINLLESVTDRPRGGVAVVEEKVASPRAQTILYAFVIALVLVAGMGYDYFTASAQKAAANTELENQKRINNEMNAVNRERADLEKKTKEIEARIEAIQKLRASQQGPSAVLAALRERVSAVPGLYLESVAQTGNNVEIVGLSPNEAAVTRFGQSLEFSSGLFSNLNIETERKPADYVRVSLDSESIARSFNPQGSEDPNAPKPQVVKFTIKCSYTPAQPQNSQPAAPAPNNQAAQH